MPETPDFDTLAKPLASVIRDSETRDLMTTTLRRELRILWNERGAVDIAR